MSYSSERVTITTEQGSLRETIDLPQLTHHPKLQWDLVRLFVVRKHWVILIRIKKDSPENTLLLTQNDIKNYLTTLTQTTFIYTHDSDTMYL